MVYCQTTACAAVLHQPCGHTICRSHALCGVQLEDVVVWHPDNCVVCFDLVTTLGSDSASPEQKSAARATLKVWVGGFARNVKSKRPYVLSDDYCSLIYPNAKSSAAVARHVAAPIITHIDATIAGFIDPEQDPSDAPGDLEDNVASMNLDVEPMLLDDPDTGRVVSEAGVSGAEIPILSPSLSSSSDRSSFHGFSGDRDSSQRLHPVPPKNKSRTLPKVHKPHKASHGSKQNTKLSSKASGSSSKSRDPGVHSATPAASPGLSESAMLRIVSEMQAKFVSEIQSKMDTMFSNIGQRLGALEQGAPERVQSSLIPDASKLPQFAKNNPWRMALHSPFSDGMLTLEGLGTRPLEDFEFFPPGLAFPFHGYARLTEEALVRLDKVPKETVIFPKEQAQSVWARFLNDISCTNTMLTPYKSSFTMFLMDKNSVTPCVNKVAELAFQYALEEKPLPPIREVDPISLLLPSGIECWDNVHTTFTSGKLAADCASVMFNERLPRLPESLIKQEYDSRLRVGRTLNLATSTESIALTYDTESIFKSLNKATLQSLYYDLYDFATAKRKCRKHVLAEATIRHEPNKLIRSSCWGSNLIPEDLVEEVLAEATRVNQSLKARWGLTPKRISDPAIYQARGRKKLRPYTSIQYHLQGTGVELDSRTSSSEQISSTFHSGSGRICPGSFTKERRTRNETPEVSRSAVQCPEEGFKQEKSDSRPIPSQLVHSMRQVSNAYRLAGADLTSPWGRHHLYRSYRRLLSRPDSETLPSVPRLSLRGQKLLLQGDAFRAQHRPKDLHKVSRSRCSGTQESRDSSSSLSGRLAHLVRHLPKLPKSHSQSHPLSSISRLPDQLQEVPSSSKIEVPMARPAMGSYISYSLSSQTQEVRDCKEHQTLSQRQSKFQTTPREDSGVPSVCLSDGSSSEGKIERFQSCLAFEGEPEAPGQESPPSSHSTGKTSSLDKSKQSVKVSSPSISASEFNHSHGRILVRLGRLFSAQESSRSLDSLVPPISHQCARGHGSSSIPETACSSQETTPSSGPRQRSGGPLPQQRRVKVRASEPCSSSHILPSSLELLASFSCPPGGSPEYVMSSIMRKCSWRLYVAAGGGSSFPMPWLQRS
ncbi:uncharacterized protein [Palaemon carinicauda]|uniref:uncharacterized protein n=1 Tax=Palaemon carinicauda TaxID=392227 RepID=UPI0035B5B112